MLFRPISMAWLRIDDIAMLKAHERSWTAALLRLLDDAGHSIDRANRDLKGAERALVVADFEREWKRIDEVLTELVGPSGKPGVQKQAKQNTECRQFQSPVRERHRSSCPGPLGGLWPGPQATRPRRLPVKIFLALLKKAGAETVGWESYNPVKVPGPRSSPSRLGPDRILPWLAGRPVDRTRRRQFRSRRRVGRQRH